MKNKIVIILIGLTFVFLSCNHYKQASIRLNYKTAEDLQLIDSSHAGLLKAHMKNGQLYIFDKSWELNGEESTVSGNSSLYDSNRKLLNTGFHEIAISDVGIFEANEPLASLDKKRRDALLTMTIINSVGLVTCIIVPKACYGSCPTFYYQNDDNLNYAKAEGFSSAVAPSLEYTDVDALNNALYVRDNFILTMKNEAYETHAVNAVHLLAVKREKGERIFQNEDGQFYKCDKMFPLQSAMAAEGDITDKLLSIDDLERFSLTDSFDLRKKETIELTFENKEKIQDAGIVINFRQTLLSTFLFYTALGYMGDEVGTIFAELESSKLKQNAIKTQLNGLSAMEVRIYNQQTGKWQLADILSETGPIAKNLQFVKIPFNCKNQETIRVRLIAAKGTLRLDQVALANVIDKVTPITINPKLVSRNGIDDSLALMELSYNDGDHLTSLPGDTWKIEYKMPTSNEDYELFISSTGYYLEWMRPDWIKEKDLDKLKNMLLKEEDIWRALAVEFKTQEWGMESTFWSSKYSQ